MKRFVVAARPHHFLTSYDRPRKRGADARLGQVFVATFGAFLALFAVSRFSRNP